MHQEASPVHNSHLYVPKAPRCKSHLIHGSYPGTLCKGSPQGLQTQVQVFSQPEIIFPHPQPRKYPSFNALNCSFSTKPLQIPCQRQFALHIHLINLSSSTDCCLSLSLHFFESFLEISHLCGMLPSRRISVHPFSSALPLSQSTRNRRHTHGGFNITYIACSTWKRCDCSCGDSFSSPH